MTGQEHEVSVVNWEKARLFIGNILNPSTWGQDDHFKC